MSKHSNAKRAAKRSGLKSPPYTPAQLDEIQERCTTKGKAGGAPAQAGRVPGLDHAPFVPPVLIGGEVISIPQPVSGGTPSEYHRIVLTDKGPKIVPLQRAMGEEKCVIDYLAFTVDESILRRVAAHLKPFSDEEFCLAWGEYCKSALLRLECEIKLTRSGLHGYAVSARVGQYGMVSAGGIHSSLHVQFSGHAFACADEEFPQRLHDFIKSARSVNITRIDIAFDDFAGEIFPVRQIPEMWKAGLFTAARSPRPPMLDRRGDWDCNDPDQRGLTAYIGRRDSGKYLRAYEKGRQLGDKLSNWVRAELELHGDVFHLIPEMLVRPTSFFVMAYPALARVEYAGIACKLERIAQEGFDTVEKLLNIIRHQYGAHLDVLRKEFFNFNDKELLDRISRKPREVPSNLQKAINLSDALTQRQKEFTEKLATDQASHAGSSLAVTQEI